jgi:hypothetical protein
LCWTSSSSAPNHQPLPKYTHRSTSATPIGAPRIFLNPNSPKPLQLLPPRNPLPIRTFPCRVYRGRTPNPPPPRTLTHEHQTAKHPIPGLFSGRASASLSRAGSTPVRLLPPHQTLPSVLLSFSFLLFFEDFRLSNLKFEIHFPHHSPIGVHSRFKTFPASHGAPRFLAFYAFFAVIYPSLQSRNPQTQPIGCGPSLPCPSVNSLVHPPARSPSNPENVHFPHWSHWSFPAHLESLPDAALKTRKPPSQKGQKRPRKGQRQPPKRQQAPQKGQKPGPKGHKTHPITPLSAPISSTFSMRSTANHYQWWLADAHGPGQKPSSEPVPGHGV